MARYQKKPIVVEAVQWDGVMFNEHIPPWVLIAARDGTIHRSDDYLHIRTPSGEQTCRPGDWVIKGTHDIYPCSGEVFAATYEAVSDEHYDIYHGQMQGGAPR